MDNSDEHFMRLALTQARKAWGETFPNPMVGAVLVRDGKVIACGYHHRDGSDHAEIDCLRKVDFQADGCRMYVTLEPCSTHGRTGACSEAIKGAKVSSVVIGALDPNPAHCGRAVEIFRQSSIDCICGVLEKECSQLNFVFNKNIVSSQALLALKYAISADAKITKVAGYPTRITSDLSQADVMKWRRFFPAIAVGLGTLLSDNPSLTSRIEKDVSCGERLIFDSSLRLAKLDITKFNVFTDSFSEKTRIVCDCSASTQDEDFLKRRGLRIMRIPYLKDSADFWAELKRALYKERICALYVEGGAKIFASVCSAREADYIFEYKAKDVFGEGLNAFDKKYFSINPVETAVFGSDNFLAGFPIWTQK